jgi:mono/diheme cytochrome c family protein
MVSIVLSYGTTAARPLPNSDRSWEIAQVIDQRKVIVIMKKIAAALVGIPLVAAALLVSVPARTAADDDAAALYNGKCKMCHGATAEKKIDKTKADDALMQIILDGKAAEKPPNMPAYKDKGLTADQAKALVTYIKSVQ